jgi:hypothetical protein
MSALPLPAPVLAEHAFMNSYSLLEITMLGNLKPLDAAARMVIPKFK